MKKQLIVALLSINTLFLNSGSEITEKSREYLKNSKFEVRTEYIKQQLWELHDEALEEEKFEQLLQDLYITKYLDVETRKKVEKIAIDLNINKKDLYLVMYFESSCNPQAVNKHSKATGLIQFMPSTAKQLGTSVEKLYNMSAYDQLDYVYKYLKPYSDKYDLSLRENLYLSIFFPLALDKDCDYVIGKKGSKVVLFNDSLDLNRDGTITAKEIKESAYKLGDILT